MDSGFYILENEIDYSYTSWRIFVHENDGRLSHNKKFN